MPFLYARQNPLDDARNTLSSWDNCMAKAYCKWPVIIGIVVGGLIAFSVIFCIARCLCCAAECTICCCKCCTCCCPSGSSGSGHKRMKSEPTYPPYAPNPHAANPYNANPYAQAHAAAPPAPLNQQYRSHAAPAFAPAPTYAHVQERPQFATFDSPSKPANEDALPAMPSWGDARDRHVEVEEQPVPEKRGDMEMDRLNHNGSVTNTSMAGMAAVPRRSPVPTRSPVSPVDGYGYNQGFENEPLVGAAPHRSPHASPAPYSNARPYVQQDDYRRGSPAQNLSPVYGAGEGYARNQSYDRHSPAPQQQPHDPYDHYDQHDAQSATTTRHTTTSPQHQPGNARHLQSTRTPQNQHEHLSQSRSRSVRTPASDRTRRRHRTRTLASQRTRRSILGRRGRRRRAWRGRPWTGRIVRFRSGRGGGVHTGDVTRANLYPGIAMALDTFGKDLLWYYFVRNLTVSFF
ncbi:hypothetical protein HBH56_150880 [Parastagonospora nodorum]|nr:hypothetical protein HBH56_150880 [Parastagonospora nodorum]KAH3928524.1 hypothetical protein HBH54_136780 [Parastagonospora nodorum]KAH4142439.1 hypothetical protein HBH45_053430 [Parastagonospora nodorum]KAH4156028.1 hypothetical protein HBH44_130170 [Parastagonospora nodorum]KAH4575661.1 hypothetical protein HBH84_074780 [Parastagonospora nodorum]